MKTDFNKLFLEVAELTYTYSDVKKIIRAEYPNITNLAEYKNIASADRRLPIDPKFSFTTSAFNWIDYLNIPRTFYTPEKFINRLAELNIFSDTPNLTDKLRNAIKHDSLFPPYEFLSDYYNTDLIYNIIPDKTKTLNEQLEIYKSNKKYREWQMSRYKKGYKPGPVIKSILSLIPRKYREIIDSYIVSYIDARSIIHNEYPYIKSIKQYKDIACKDRRLPIDPPSYRNYVKYNKSEFNWNDYLGISKNPSADEYYKKVYKHHAHIDNYIELPYSEAKNILHTEYPGITSIAEYRNIAENDRRLALIPETVYGETMKWMDYLGINGNYCSLGECINIMRKAGIYATSEKVISKFYNLVSHNSLFPPYDFICEYFDVDNFLYIVPHKNVNIEEQYKIIDQWHKRSIPANKREFIYRIMLYAGKKNYISYSEAKAIIKKHHYNNFNDYKNMAIIYNMPIDPEYYYDNFEGWKSFLNINYPNNTIAKLQNELNKNKLTITEPTLMYIIDNISSENPPLNLWTMYYNIYDPFLDIVKPYYTSTSTVEKQKIITRKDRKRIRQNKIKALSGKNI